MLEVWAARAVAFRPLRTQRNFLPDLLRSVLTQLWWLKCQVLSYFPPTFLSLGSLASRVFLLEKFLVFINCVVAGIWSQKLILVQHAWAFSLVAGHGLDQIFYFSLFPKLIAAPKRRDALAYCVLSMGEVSHRTGVGTGKPCVLFSDVRSLRWTVEWKRGLRFRKGSSKPLVKFIATCRRVAPLR